MWRHPIPPWCHKYEVSATLIWQSVPFWLFAIKFLLSGIRSHQRISAHDMPRYELWWLRTVSNYTAICTRRQGVVILTYFNRHHLAHFLHEENKENIIQTFSSKLKNTRRRCEVWCHLSLLTLLVLLCLSIGRSHVIVQPCKILHTCTYTLLDCWFSQYSDTHFDSTDRQHRRCPKGTPNLGLHPCVWLGVCWYRIFPSRAPREC